MLKKHLQFNFAFILIFIVQLLVESDPITSKLVLLDFHYAVKPLITISLLLFLVYHTQLKGRFVKRVFGGLLFGLFGDCFLMFQTTHPSFFLLGLASFLVGHLLYITAFYLDYIWNSRIQKGYTRWALVIFGVFCIVFYIYLRPYLADMKIPVMVYAFVISLMGIMAANRKGRVNTLSFKLVMWGAVLFILSDAILAYNRFVHPFETSGLWIMSTYMLAQYLITMGTVERKMKKKSAM